MNANRILLLGLAAALLSACGKKLAETRPVRKDVTETVFASGQLRADQRYDLTATADGFLTALNFAENDTVRSGDLLAQIENRETEANRRNAEALYDFAEVNTTATAPTLREARNQVDIALQQLRSDSLLQARYRRLLDANSIARLDYEQALLQYQKSREQYESAIASYQRTSRSARETLVGRNADRQIATIRQNDNGVRAPLGGVVLKKIKQTGEYVRKGDVIATIAGTGQIHALVSIDENSIERIRVGQEAFVRLNTGKEHTYKARVTEIYPRFDEATQSFSAKLVFDSLPSFRLDGTQLQSNIVVGVQKNVLLVPRNFVDYSNQVLIKGQKQPVKITTGFTSNNWVQVLSGIDEHTVLVTENIAENKVTTSETGAQMR